MRPKESVVKYLNGPFKDVQGWCSPNNWQIIWPIVEFQEQMGLRNPVAEIGVYHGKFFIGLVVTKNVPGNYAIDVFDMQEFNLDGAGKGNLGTLKENLVKCGVDPDDVTLLQADSMALADHDLLEIREKTGGFSLFSIDGCHLPEHTVNDIKIAMSLTVPAGLIFVDDYTNPHWPGVLEGVSKLYFTDYPRFVPVAFGHNKLFLCHLSYHQKFLRIIADSLKRANIAYKVVKRFGYESISANLDPASRDYLPN